MTTATINSTRSNAMTYNALREKISGVLATIQVQDINVEIGGEKRFMQLSIEQMKAKIENFPVEVKWTGVIEGEEGEITTVSHKGKFVRGLLVWRKNGKIIDEQFLNEKEVQDAIQELNQ